MWLKDASGGYVNTDHVERLTSGGSSGTYFINAQLARSTASNSPVSQQLAGTFTTQPDVDTAIDSLVCLLGSFDPATLE